MCRLDIRCKPAPAGLSLTWVLTYERRRGARPTAYTMKLFYGRKLLTELGIRRPSEYGFDTFQIGPFFSGATQSKLLAQVGDVDEYFNQEDVDFVLAIGFEAAGSNYHGNNDILYPDPPGHPGSEEVDGIGKIDRESWHDNPSHEFYTNFGTLFASAVNTYGTRFKGVRWNHEVQPWRFKLGSKWEEYAQENVSAQWNAIQSNTAEKDRWDEWREAVADGTMGENAAYEGDGEDEDGIYPSPYRDPINQGVQEAYKAMVNFQIQVQQKMIGHLSNKIEEAQQPTVPLRFLVYSPVYFSPAYAHSEYTLDLRPVDKANIVWEMGSWENTLPGHRNKWADDAAWDDDTPPNARDYYFAMQQLPHATGLDDRLTDLVTTFQNMREPTTDPVSSTWQDSLAFWNRWDGSNPQAPPDHIWNKHKQRRFMTKIKEILTA